MAKLRNSLGATPDDPCGPLSNTEVPLVGNIFSGCTDEYVKSWISAGDVISERIAARISDADVQDTNIALGWQARWRATVADLQNKSVLNPTGMNWGFGFALMWSDTDARRAAALAVEGTEILESMGGELPASLDADKFKKIAPATLTGADWFAIGVTVAGVGIGGYYVYDRFIK